MKWPEYKLIKLVDRFISGGTPSTKVEGYWSGDIPWITGADFSDGEVILGRRYINQSGLENSATNVVPMGSILMVTRTGVGKIAIAPVDVAISQDITGIVLKRGLFNDFVIAAIRSRMSFILAAQRGATIKGITREDVENLSIPLPALSEQKRIVRILNQVDALRKKGADADAKAARILPALFYKIFGDPATNPMRWEVLSFFDAAEDVSAGQPKIQKKNFLLDGLYPIVDQGQNDIAGYTNDEQQLFRGQLPVIIFGDHTLTFKYIDFPFGIGADGVRVLRAHPGFHPLYIFHALRLLHLHSVGYSRHFKFLKGSKLMRPPEQEQERFAQCAATIQFELSKMKASGKVINDLFGILLRCAFSGDLTAKWREGHMKELLVEMEEQARVLKEVLNPN